MERRAVLVPEKCSCSTIHASLTFIWRKRVYAGFIRMRTCRKCR
ncbi:hypothetical protein ANCCAN_03645 [Ancylostoma caninum]|uniref:Uncharacterized protein n=1 Tax=Ancylostoma caninum TaxID=29170 RepID=A0A368H385_ANCCA|nr:hypothetical protein ANCCAN_03645 [Ancylostoma caninum]